MILPDNNNDILLIYADWLEDQGICTKEFREEIENPITNSWHFEHRGGVSDVGGSANGNSAGGIGSAGVFGVGGSGSGVGGSIGGSIVGGVGGSIGGG